jgi:hypothetical protein
VHFRTYQHRHAESILNGNYKLKKEIERILQRLELRPPVKDSRWDSLSIHRQIQRAFLRHEWKTEVLVSPRTARKHRFDAFKDGVAIEIELSHRERLYRDYLRFVMAEMDGRLDVGVIIVVDKEARFEQSGNAKNGIPQLEDVVDDLRTLHSAIAVPIWVIALS